MCHSHISCEDTYEDQHFGTFFFKSLQANWLPPRCNTTGLVNSLTGDGEIEKTLCDVHPCAMWLHLSKSDQPFGMWLSEVPWPLISIHWLWDLKTRVMWRFTLHMLFSMLHTSTLILCHYDVNAISLVNWKMVCPHSGLETWWPQSGGMTCGSTKASQPTSLILELTLRRRIGEWWALWSCCRIAL